MTDIFCIYTELVVFLLRYLLSCIDTSKAKPYNMILLFSLVLPSYIKKNRLSTDSSPKRLLRTNLVESLHNVSLLGTSTGVKNESGCGWSSASIYFLSNCWQRLRAKVV